MNELKNNGTNTFLLSSSLRTIQFFYFYVKRTMFQHFIENRKIKKMALACTKWKAIFGNISLIFEPEHSKFENFQLVVVPNLFFLRPKKGSGDGKPIPNILFFCGPLHCLFLIITTVRVLLSQNYSKVSRCTVKNMRPTRDRLRMKMRVVKINLKWNTEKKFIIGHNSENNQNYCLKV